ncbi:MAG: glycerophosphodiester phosphodiesterase family protein [Candidatus Hydrogenedentes bacterium]|nr:glycerophosphodiester phosphodiesterase family protein [Candidatus Hydrogenedentota bacterium]
MTVGFAVLGLFVNSVVSVNAAAGDRLNLPDGFLLVAHRGGVVTETTPENSFAALEEAIRRGYTHVEVDVQCTADGYPVCLHDRSLKRAAGVDGLIDKLTLAEVRDRAPEERVPGFDAYCQRCAGRIGLMVDIKMCPESLRGVFAERLRGSLERHGLSGNTLFIGRSELRPYLEGGGLMNWRGGAAALALAQDIGRNFFVFRHAPDLDRERVRAYQARGLQVIVSINTAHYRGRDPLASGARDAAAMLALGVDGLQIDSEYEPAVKAFFKDRPAVTDDRHPAALADARRDE